jgi:alanyl-tRNA synthetase
VTSRIYYTDPYCRRFDASVTKAFLHDGRPAVVLDRTAFYPTSGGQPFDTGKLVEANGAGAASGAGGASEAGRASEAGEDVGERRGPYGSAIDVVDTVDLDGDVIHVLSEPVHEGAAVRGEVDWGRRFDHMQQHTGQHILSAAFDRLFDNRTVGFHLGAETSTIDLLREMSWAQIARAEHEANSIIWEDREVSVRFVTSEHASALPLRKEPSREGTLRLIEVKDFDLSACGGTHVSRTGAIGSVVVAAAEKFKGGTRVTFACGSRAVRAFQSLRDAVGGSVRLLSVLPNELPASIERMQAETKDLRRTLKRFQEALASHEAARLIGASELGQGPVLLMVEGLDGWDASGLKAIATHITAQASAVVALFSKAPPHAVVIARSPGVPLDAAAVLGVLTERFGGRGGGKADLAQGGGLGGDLSAILATTRELLENRPFSLS